MHIYGVEGGARWSGCVSCAAYACNGRKVETMDVREPMHIPASDNGAMMFMRMRQSHERYVRCL